MAALPVPVLAPAVFPTPDLHDFKYSDLFKATEDEISAIAWCQNNGLIAKDKMCASCGSPTALRERDTVKNKGFYFRCTHLRIATIIQFVYFWCRDYVIQDELQFQLGIVGEHTIVDWKNFCRDICLEYFIRNPVVIGGPGQTVEIDECLLVRRKYNVGHQVREQWVFGGYDVATKVGFMVPVDRRDAATLLPIIQKYIAPGTTIISDLWAAYNTIGTLGYQHLTVNHSLNFVDPTTGACTNHIESVWQKAKQKHKQRYGTHRELLHTYLAEFMWRQRFGCSFHDFVAHVRAFYPV